MDEEGILAADIPPELPDRLDEGQALDVADRAADLADADVRALGRLADAPLDLVGDVRDHLHRPAEVVPAPLFRDDGVVDLAGGEVVPPRHAGRDVAFVVPQIEVGLSAVVGHEDLAVLERAHRAGVDVEVGIELLERDPQPARLEQQAERGRGDPLAERRDDPAGHHHDLRHRPLLSLAPRGAFRSGTWSPPLQLGELLGGVHPRPRLHAREHANPDPALERPQLLEPLGLLETARRPGREL